MVEKQESAAEGAADFMYFMIFGFYGLFLSTLLIIINNVIDFFWGSQIVDIYFTVISTIIVSLYFVFHRFSRVSFMYLLGWIIGMFVLYALDLSFFNINLQKIIFWVILPTIIIIIRFIIHKGRGN